MTSVFCSITCFLLNNIFQKDVSGEMEKSKTQECVVTVNLPRKFLKSDGKNQVVGLNFVIQNTEKKK